MRTKLLFAAVALISLPFFAAATNYDVSIEQSADRYICLDSTTGTYFVKLGEKEYAGHSALYSNHIDVIGKTYIEMYSSVMMCTGQYESSKTMGTFTVHGSRDQIIQDRNLSDIGLCAVANKPPEINFIFATVPKVSPTPTSLKMLSFQVRGSLSDENAGFSGLEWKLESSCFEAVTGNGFLIDKTIFVSPSAKNCKVKLTVEDAQEGYAFAEFFVPSNMVTTN